MTPEAGSPGTAPATFLAFVEPVPGRLYPLVATLQELQRRGHRVIVRTGQDEVDLLRSIGIEAEVLAPELAAFNPTDWQARTRFGALLRALDEFGDRARPQVADLGAAIDAHQPDVVILDETSWGAAAAAEHSGRPWAFSVPSPVPIGSPGVPPFGLGLRPRVDTVGRIRDRVVRPLTVGTLARVIARHVNPLRVELGLRPLHRLDEFYLAADLLLNYGGTVRLPAHRLAGQGPAGRARAVGTALHRTTVARRAQPAARARHLLHRVPERRTPRRDGLRRVRGRALRRGADHRRGRRVRRRCAQERPGRTVRAALGRARPGGLRGLSRGHGHHAEGPRARRPPWSPSRSGETSPRSRDASRSPAPGSGCRPGS